MPSLYIRSVAQRVKPYLDENVILVNASKGLEEKTFLTMSQVIQSEYPDNAVGVITGPSHAEEVGRGVPTTVVAASKMKPLRCRSRKRSPVTPCGSTSTQTLWAARSAGH